MTRDTGPEVVHRIKWFAYASNGQGYVERIPHTASMRGSWDGWDAECSCGWESRTGGAIKARVQEYVADHKWRVANGYWPESEALKRGQEWLERQRAGQS